MNLLQGCLDFLGFNEVDDFTFNCDSSLLKLRLLQKAQKVFPPQKAPKKTKFFKRNNKIEPTEENLLNDNFIFGCFNCKLSSDEESSFKILTIPEYSSEIVQRLGSISEQDKVLLVICFPCSKEQTKLLLESIKCIAFAWHLVADENETMESELKNEISDQKFDAFINALRGLLFLHTLEDSGYN